MGERVVVTGMGTINPLGHSVPETWEALVAGRSGIGPITQYDASDHKVKIAGEVKGFDPAARLSHKEARRTDRFAQFVLVAADEALTDAGLTLDPDQENDHVSVIVGSGIGGLGTLLDNAAVLRERGHARVSALMVPMLMANAGAGQVALRYGIHGSALAVASACATGTDAIGQAMEMIRRGVAQVVVCGGGEASLLPLPMAGFANMGALSLRNGPPQEVCRPFDADRDGFVAAEGAAILLLESLTHARRRGARIRAEVVGYGSSCDAHHITAPDESGRGAIRAMTMALKSAGLRPEGIDYINAHGTSTPLNDAMETRAIHQVFGAAAPQIPVNATKSMTGHLLGAAGALEAIVSVKTLETGTLHPTINYQTPDPACDLDYVPNQARQAHPHTALSNSFGFGGHNASLIFQTFER
jgi:3-oxoacyl-[acyl-carrier-protein] synthase II